MSTIPPPTLHPRFTPWVSLISALWYAHGLRQLLARQVWHLSMELLQSYGRGKPITLPNWTPCCELWGRKWRQCPESEPRRAQSGPGVLGQGKASCTFTSRHLQSRQHAQGTWGRPPNFVSLTWGGKLDTMGNFHGQLYSFTLNSSSHFHIRDLRSLKGIILWKWS